MTKVFLTEEEYNAATSGAEISGSPGFEQVNVFVGVTGLDIASTIERVDFPGNIADFTFSSFGNSLTIRDLGGAVIAAISGAGGKQIVFGDGALSVAFNGVVTVGGATVGSVPAPITPIETDTGTASQTAPKQYGWITDNTYVSGADGGYSIKVEVHNCPNPLLLQGIASAAERISESIIEGVPDHRGVDDIWVTVHFTDLDGYWGTGSASGLRPDSLLPIMGMMKLDIDASQSIGAERFEDLVFHEFLHTLGFGTLWDQMGLIAGDRFTGPKAIAAYHSEFPSIAANDPNSHLGVPIETDGAAGTAGKHWDEATFGDEVMTGYLNGANYVSNMTIAALQDMGYEVII